MWKHKEVRGRKKISIVYSGIHCMYINQRNGPSNIVFTIYFTCLLNTYSNNDADIG